MDNSNRKRYWLYAPGENASEWDEFYKAKIMGIGWDEIKDLSQYKSKNEIKKALEEISGNNVSKSNDANTVYDFYKTINIGDIIIAKKGTKELLGYGVVESGYIYDKDRPKYKNIRKVNWKTKGSWDVDFTLVQKTLTDVTKDKEKYLEIFNRNDAKITKEENEMNALPLNQILYGPPGTGKTYKVVELALRIIGEDSEELFDERSKLKERFNELRNEGQIEFITFHQSYSYEEFVEGLKAETDEDNEDRIKYYIKNGIFKEIAKKAKENYENSKKSSVLNIDELLNDFAEEIDNKTDRLTLKGNVVIEELNRNKDGDFISFTIGGSVNSAQRLTKSIIKRDFEKYLLGEIKSSDDIKPRYESKSIRHGNAIYYFALYEKLKSFLENNKDKYQSKTEKLRNYVLIIDEINRGNISKIFGELITLIEEDKRIGKNEEINVRLPYSNELFGVPDNLYIIGTMNTADRSIALLDTALRRRFEFVEMMPRYDILPDNLDGINLQKILEKINKRIEYLYDRDHTIGHAYFMGIESFEQLKNVFLNKIIPLLAEYFYDDWEKIRFVLADNQKGEDYQFIVKDNIKTNKLFGDDGVDNMEEREIYTINNKAFDEEESYRGIYETVKGKA